MKSFFLNHILPIGFAIALVISGLLWLNSNATQSEAKEPKLIKGTQNKFKGRYTNFSSEGDQDELNYMASIANKKQLTLFGSSEFCALPSVTYNFFPDSLNRQVLGIGHAYHQELSILVELMAAHEFNENSEICIFISPEWFKNFGGTNTAAFIEFATQNFLSRIYNDSLIPDEYKSYIGEYIHTNSDDFEGLTPVMKQLNDLYLNNSSNNPITNANNFLKTNVVNHIIKTEIQSIEYRPILKYNEIKIWKGDYNQTAKTLQDSFVSKIKDNNLFIYDDYYNKYLLDDEGNGRRYRIQAIDLETSIEYKDFKVLMKYIKSRNMKASFVIIPFNPYYYYGTETLAPLMDSLTTTFEKNDFSYLNLYSNDTTNYEPGTLKDVMHLGEYGWMKVNQFIDSIYYK